MAAGIVKLVGDGTMGRYLSAVRGSELAANSVGIDVYRLRVLVFALSAALAGVGGALFGSLEGSLSANDFGYQISAVLLVVVAIVGLGSITGAVVAGVVYTTLQVAVTSLPTRFAGLVAVLFGLATLSYTRHPEGFLDVLSGRAQLVHRRAAGPPPAGRPPVPGAPAAGRRGPRAGDADPGGRRGRVRRRATAPRRCWWPGGSPSSSGASSPSTTSTSRSAAGEAVGVVGPNGAGKTTLFNCLFGLEEPDEGSVVFNGRRIDRLPVWKRSRMGIGRTFQRMELFEGMTVADHLLVAEQAASGTVRIWRDFLHRGGPTPAELHHVEEVLDLLGTRRAGRPARRDPRPRPRPARRAGAGDDGQAPTADAGRAVLGARRRRHRPPVPHPR